MLEMNKVMLIGNLTRDPEPIQTQGTSGAKFGIAVNKRWKDKNTNEQREETCFVDMVAWRKTADFVLKRLTKGSRVYVEGALKLDQWETNGEKRSKITVTAERIQFAEPKRDVEQQQAAPDNPPAAPAQAPDSSAPRMTKKEAYTEFWSLRTSNMSIGEINKAWMNAIGGMDQASLSPQHWYQIGHTPLPSANPVPPVDDPSGDLPF